MSGMLSLCATPIGNLEDITLRVVRTLREADCIFAEDTRHTLGLLNHLQIKKPLVSCHQHNEESKGGYLAERMLQENIDLALTTDAGTPCVSDPGYALVRAAWERGIEVVPVPGCCAGVAALSASGFDAREWAFYGFLPREKKELRDKLRQMARGVPVAIVHESPYRVVELMEQVAEVLPACRVSASCDLTKLHEKTIRGSAEQVLADLQANPKAEKGEYCLVLDMHQVRLPEEPAPVADISLEARLAEQMLSGMTLRDAQSELVLQGEKKNAVKAAALRLKRLFAEDEA